MLNQGHAYRLDVEPMQELREEKDLGILIDDKLKFHKQMTAVISKASKILAVVWHSYTNLNKSTLLLLYQSLVRSFLEYGNAIWGPFGKVHQKSPVCVQQGVTHMVDSIRHLEYPK